MSKSKKTTDNLPTKNKSTSVPEKTLCQLIDDLVSQGNFIVVMEELLCQKIMYDAASIGIDEGKRKRKKRRLTPFEKEFLEENYEDRYEIFCMFARTGEYIYREAVRLQLPTRPYNLLHLHTNWERANDTEKDNLMDKANAELLQLVNEAESLIPKTTGGKVEQKNPLGQNSKIAENKKSPKTSYDGKANENNHQSEMPYEINLLNEIADKLKSWAEERKTGFQKKIEEERQNKNRYKTIGEFLKEQDTFSNIVELSPISTYFALPNLSDEFTFAEKSFQFNENFTPATMLIEIENKLYYENIEITKLAAEIHGHLDDYGPESFEYKALLLQVRTFFAITIPDIAKRIRKIAEMTNKKIAIPQKYIPKITSGGKMGETKTITPKSKKLLSEKATAVLELLKTLPEHKGLTGNKIIEALSQENIFIDQSTLTKNIIPVLKKDYGVKNQPRIGYYIAK
jgi:hypothetical protein